MTTVTYTRLVHPHTSQPIFDALATWMQALTLTDLVELYWKAQALRAAKMEREAARRADPDDMFAKSAEYVAAYYARQEPAR